LIILWFPDYKRLNDLIFKPFRHKPVSHLPDYPFKYFQSSFKWRILNGRVKPGGCFHHGFRMAKHIKTVFTMILSHPTIPTPPKRQMMIGKMPA
jgi:hypothetical protein